MHFCTLIFPGWELLLVRWELFRVHGSCPEPDSDDDALAV